MHLVEEAQLHQQERVRQQPADAVEEDERRLRRRRVGRRGAARRAVPVADARAAARGRHALGEAAEAEGDAEDGVGRLEQQVVREWLGARLEGVERVRHRADAVADAGGELARKPHLDRLDEAADLVALPRRQLLGRRVVHGERDEPHVVAAPRLALAEEPAAQQLLELGGRAVAQDVRPAPQRLRRVGLADERRVQLLAPLAHEAARVEVEGELERQRERQVEDERQRPRPRPQRPEDVEDAAARVQRERGEPEHVFAW